nr:hypothetical protein [Variovorax boronicumulans]
MKVGARAYTAPANARFAPVGAYVPPASTPARPGALAAFRVPSLVNGRQVLPEQMREQRRSPPPAAPAQPATQPMPTQLPPSVSPMHRPPRPLPGPRSIQAGAAKESRGYKPRAGSAVERVLEHLRTHGGHVLYSDVQHRFGVSRSGIYQVFETALKAGALQKFRIGSLAAFALPGYEPPPVAPCTLRLADTSQFATAPATLGEQMSSVVQALVTAQVALGEATTAVQALLSNARKAP